ncbi:maltose acetyltransferase domain-containing protein [Desulfocurvibacter africanus]|uniref:maltose acetyltransferase domain-containing protein n=1 Tax=Desulfocurvibacter africanus TaxID=873 RepID=UPI001ED8C563|nr:maltose acetyltransferase domain-containing protein [Desulfocurvibacter africanus]
MIPVSTESSGEQPMPRSEKDKMLAGELYDAGDGELVRERNHARKLVFAFNHASPAELEARQAILRQLIAAQGRFYIEAPFHCDYGYNIQVGENLNKLLLRRPLRR